MGPFEQYSSGTPTLFSGVNPSPAQMLDFSGMPGMNGPMGMVLQSILQPLLTQAMGGFGMIPGQFLPTQNLMDFHRNRDFLMGQQQSMKVAADADKETYFKFLRGAARFSGAKYDEPTLRTMAGDVSQAMPYMGMFMSPGMLDELHGPRGSAVIMAQQMHAAGRYAYDPVTGRTGLSGATAGDLTRRVHESLFGDKADIAEMKGVGAGRTGQLYDEMVRRGFMGGTGTKQEDREKALNDPKMEEQLRTFEADRIARGLKNMSGVVSAMRDIFGDMGKPNAPMGELINGLQALTQGGLAQYDPAKLSQMARTIQRTAKDTGMGMDATFQMLAMGAAKADQLGIDRSVVSPTQLAAASFGHAFGQFGESDVKAFRRLDKERATIADQALRLGAAASPLQSRMNAILRMSDEFGIKADSDFGKLATALKEGKEKVTIGDKEFNVSELMSTTTLRQMAGREGVTAETFDDLMSRTKSNQEYAAKYTKSLDLTRRLQGQLDIDPMIRSVSTHVMSTAFQGMSRDTAIKTAQVATETLRSMDVSVRADPVKRNEAIAEAIWKSLAPEEQAKVGDKQALVGPASRIWAGLDERVLRSHRLAPIYGGAHGLFDLTNRKVLGGAEEFRKETEARVDIDEAMSGLGRQGPLRRLMGMLEDVKPEDDTTKTLMKAFGGIATDDVVKQLKAPLQELSQLQKQLRSLSPDDKARRDTLLKDVRLLIGGDPNAINTVKKQGIRAYMDKHGIMIGEIETDEEIKAKLDKGKRAIEAKPGDPPRPSKRISLDSLAPPDKKDKSGPLLLSEVPDEPDVPEPLREPSRRQLLSELHDAEIRKAEPPFRKKVELDYRRPEQDPLPEEVRPVKPTKNVELSDLSKRPSTPDKLPTPLAIPPKSLPEVLPERLKPSLLPVMPAAEEGPALIKPMIEQPFVPPKPEPIMPPADEHEPPRVLPPSTGTKQPHETTTKPAQQMPPADDTTIPFIPPKPKPIDDKPYKVEPPDIRTEKVRDTASPLIPPLDRGRDLVETVPEQRVPTSIPPIKGEMDVPEIKDVRFPIEPTRKVKVPEIVDVIPITPTTMPVIPVSTAPPVIAEPVKEPEPPGPEQNKFVEPRRMPPVAETETPAERPAPAPPVKTLSPIIPQPGTVLPTIEIKEPATPVSSRSDQPRKRMVEVREEAPTTTKIPKVGGEQSVPTKIADKQETVQQTGLPDKETPSVLLKPKPIDEKLRPVEPTHIRPEKTRDTEQPLIPPLESVRSPVETVPEQRVPTSIPPIKGEADAPESKDVQFPVAPTRKAPEIIDVVPMPPIGIEAAPTTPQKPVSIIAPDKEPERSESEQSKFVEPKLTPPVKTLPTTIPASGSPVSPVIETTAPLTAVPPIVDRPRKPIIEDHDELPTKTKIPKTDEEHVLSTKSIEQEISKFTDRMLQMPVTPQIPETTTSVPIKIADKHEPTRQVSPLDKDVPFASTKPKAIDEKPYTVEQPDIRPEKVRDAKLPLIPPLESSGRPVETAPEQRVPTSIPPIKVEPDTLGPNDVRRPIESTRKAPEVVDVSTVTQKPLKPIGPDKEPERLWAEQNDLVEPKSVPPVKTLSPIIPPSGRIAPPITEIKAPAAPAAPTADQPRDHIAEIRDESPTKIKIPKADEEQSLPVKPVDQELHKFADRPLVAPVTTQSVPTKITDGSRLVAPDTHTAAMVQPIKEDRDAKPIEMLAPTDTRSRLAETISPVEEQHKAMEQHKRLADGSPPKQIPVEIPLEQTRKLDLAPTIVTSFDRKPTQIPTAEKGRVVEVITPTPEKHVESERHEFMPERLPTTIAPQRPDFDKSVPAAPAPHVLSPISKTTRAPGSVDIDTGVKTPISTQPEEKPTIHRWTPDKPMPKADQAARSVETGMPSFEQRQSLLPTGRPIDEPSRKIDSIQIIPERMPQASPIPVASDVSRPTISSILVPPEGSESKPVLVTPADKDLPIRPSVPAAAPLRPGSDTRIPVEIPLEQTRHPDLATTISQTPDRKPAQIPTAEKGRVVEVIAPRQETRREAEGHEFMPERIPTTITSPRTELDKPAPAIAAPDALAPASKITRIPGSHDRIDAIDAVRGAKTPSGDTQPAEEKPSIYQWTPDKPTTSAHQWVPKAEQATRQVETGVPSFEQRQAQVPAGDLIHESSRKIDSIKIMPDRIPQVTPSPVTPDTPRSAVSSIFMPADRPDDKPVPIPPSEKTVPTRLRDNQEPIVPTRMPHDKQDFTSPMPTRLPVSADNLLRPTSDRHLPLMPDAEGSIPTSLSPSSIIKMSTRLDDAHEFRPSNLSRSNMPIASEEPKQAERPQAMEERKASEGPTKIQVVITDGTVKIVGDRLTFDNVRGIGTTPVEVDSNA